MNGNSGIKVIFFDLGQTLIELSSFKKSMYNSLKKHLFQSNLNLDKLINEWGYETHRLFNEIRKKNYISIIKLNILSFKNILKIYKIGLSDKIIQTIVDNVWKDFIRNSKLYPDAIHALNRLKQSGYELGLITDSESNIVDGILQKHNLTNFFNVKIISGKVQAFKPNPLLFYKAIDLAKCKPNEGVYVGDSEIDIKGAVEVGLITVIISRIEIPDIGIGIRPDFRINSLFELPELVSKIDLIKR